MARLAGDPSLFHMPLGTLATWAALAGHVAASASSWYRLARERGWRALHRRRHPKAPTVGVRAVAPNELWHVDISVIVLVDRTRLYLQAVVDNFSRYVLAWQLSTHYDGSATRSLLQQAAGVLRHSLPPPAVVVDGGCENGGDAREWCAEHDIKQLLAMVDIRHSNSLIEALWRSLKRNWIFLERLTGFEQVQRRIDFWMDQHNRVMPHSAFDGQTPQQMYFGTGQHVPAELERIRQLARATRLALNRARTCGACDVPSDTEKTSVNTVMHLRSGCPRGPDRDSS
jgi:transposase InsO family protein